MNISSIINSKKRKARESMNFQKFKSDELAKIGTKYEIDTPAQDLENKAMKKKKKNKLLSNVGKRFSRIAKKGSTNTKQPVRGIFRKDQFGG